MLPNLFTNGTALLIKSLSVTDYKISLQGNWGFAYLDNNKKNDKNEVNNNANTVEK